MRELLQRVESGMQNRRLLSRGQKILVAVSGGADSMMLLHLLDSLAPVHRWKISVAHFNHKLRGRASASDEKLVRWTAEKLGLKFFVESADAKGFAVRSKLSIEMAARKLRHEFLARTARAQKISVIALAHHADDQVELFFLRLLRGAGGEGLAGMKWCSPSPADKTISLIRPLLDFSKAELLSVARENKIRYREDATNFSTDFLRNRIRNELLPLLQKNYQPGLGKAVLRVMDIVGAETELAGATAAQWLVGPGAGFEKLPVAVQRKVLQSHLTRLGLTLEFDLIEHLRTSAGRFVSISSDLAICRDAEGKILCRKTCCNPEFDSSELKLNLAGGAGQVEFSGRKFFWALKKSGGSRGRSPHQPRMEFFDADKIGGEIILRHWRPGDRFQPIGMKSAVKLQDAFVNAKIPAARRRSLILAASATGEIFWVEGLRIGERFKLTPATKRVLVWNWSKIAA